MKRLRPPLAAVVLAAIVGIAVGGCGDDDGGTVPTSAGSNVTTTIAADDVLEDGRYFVYFKSLKTSATEMSCEYDLTEFLTGEEADAAAVEDGVIAEGEHIENDYYIRNRNPKLRNAAIDLDAEVLVLESTGATNLITVDASEFADHLHLSSGYWITIAGGVVTKIEEQFVP